MHLHGTPAGHVVVAGVVPVISIRICRSAGESTSAIGIRTWPELDPAVRTLSVRRDLPDAGHVARHLQVRRRALIDLGERHADHVDRLVPERVHRDPEPARQAVVLVYAVVLALQLDVVAHAADALRDGGGAAVVLVGDASARGEVRAVVRRHVEHAGAGEAV